MRKQLLKTILPAVITSGLILTGCNKNDMGNTPDETASETSAADTSGTEAATSEPVPESQGYEPYRLRLYDNLGTGMPRPENYGEDMSKYYLDGELDDILSLMKDKEAAEKIRTETDSLFDLAAEDFHLYSDKPPQNNITTDCLICNGYLFYEVNYSYLPMKFCAVFDLRTGDRLELSDMFFEGEEFLSQLNKKVSEELQKLEIDNDHYSTDYIPMKREFAGLTEDGFYFNSNWFYFPVNNPYTASYTGIYLSISDFDTVLNIPYDMSPLFEEDTEDKIFYFFRENNFISSDDYAYSKSYQTGNIKVCLFEGSKLIPERTAEFLAEQTQNIIDTELDSLNKKYDFIMYTDIDEPLQKSYEQDGKTIYYDENYLISSGIFRNNLAYVRCEKWHSEVYEKSYNLYFDLDTLEPLSSEQLFERVYGDKKIKWEPTLLDLTDGNWSEWEKIIEDNPPDVKSLAPDNFTFKYSNGELSYYEENNDYTVFWRAESEEEQITEYKGYTPYQIKLYDSNGTGIPRPDNYGEDRTRYSVHGEPQIFFSLMKDRSVVEKINEEIDKWSESIEEKYNADGEKKYTYSCWAYNGILFYSIYDYYTFEENVIVFDMRTGERLELSDMFFEGEEFIGRLNKKIGQEIQKLTYMDAGDYEPVDYLPMKREFSGLTENEFYFNAEKICFPLNNPYFQDCRQVRVSLFDFDTVLNIPYDMTGLFEDGADKQLNFNTRNYDFSTSYFSQTGNVDIYLLDESPKLTKEQREFLNNKALSLAGSEYIQKMREKGWSIYSGDEDPVYSIHRGADGTEYKYKNIFTIDISILNNDLALVHCRQSDLWDTPVPSYSLYFDTETLEPIDIKQLFERTFGNEEYVWSYVYVYSPENDYTTMDGFIVNEAPDISKMQTEDIFTYDGSTLIYYGKVDDCIVWGDIYKKPNFEN